MIWPAHWRSSPPAPGRSSPPSFGAGTRPSRPPRQASSAWICAEGSQARAAGPGTRRGRRAGRLARRLQRMGRRATVSQACSESSEEINGPPRTAPLGRRAALPRARRRAGHYDATSSRTFLRTCAKTSSPNEHESRREARRVAPRSRCARTHVRRPASKRRRPPRHRRRATDNPTPVQLAVFEPAAAGRSVVVQARGPARRPPSRACPSSDRLVRGSLKAVQALVLCPTRELALQVSREVEQIGQFRGTKIVAIYGRTSTRQVEAYPGRRPDRRRHARARPRCSPAPAQALDPSSQIRILVLDEADEMLSMGFAREARTPSSRRLPKNRQGMFFSATLPPDIERLAQKHLRDAELVTLSSDQVGALEIDHYVYVMQAGDKIGQLVRILEVEDPESAIIFCNTRDETQKRRRGPLKARGFDADWLNGDLPQGDRERVMSATREGRLRFLVCTDVAARGIDISHLTHVINYDFPETAEQYVHRTGRTGRAGRTGTAIALVGPKAIGNLYLLRLTYKIRPIEKQLPSAGEVKTRAEMDLLQLFVDAFAKPRRPLIPTTSSLARRLLDAPRRRAHRRGPLARPPRRPRTRLSRRRPRRHVARATRRPLPAARSLRRESRGTSRRVPRRDDSPETGPQGGSSLRRAAGGRGARDPRGRRRRRPVATPIAGRRGGSRARAGRGIVRELQDARPRRRTTSAPFSPTRSDTATSPLPRFTVEGESAAQPAERGARPDRAPSRDRAPRAERGDRAPRPRRGAAGIRAIVRQRRKARGGSRGRPAEAPVRQARHAGEADAGRIRVRDQTRASSRVKKEAVDAGRLGALNGLVVGGRTVVAELARGDRAASLTPAPTPAELVARDRIEVGLHRQHAARHAAGKRSENSTATVILTVRPLRHARGRARILRRTKMAMHLPPLQPAPTPHSAGIHPAHDERLRSLLDARRGEGRRMSLEEAIAVIVPVCIDVQERHARGEKLYVHPRPPSPPAADGLALRQPAPRPARPHQRRTTSTVLAPEGCQAHPRAGRRVLERLLAVGAMLYEMVTGQHDRLRRYEATARHRRRRSPRASRSSSARPSSATAPTARPISARWRAPCTTSPR